MTVNELKTPFYLFDENECIDRVCKIKNVVTSWGGKLCYAIKANPFLISSLLPFVDKFEVCSPGELEICRKYQVPGEKILFSGVVKTKDNIEKALEYPVDVLTLESVHQWNLLKECMAELNVMGEEKSRIKIMPRLSNGAQFGMEEKQLLQIIEESKTMKNVKVEGIHYFTGTQKKGNQYEKEIDKGEHLLKEIQKEWEISELILEYGPGLAVPYFTGDDFDTSLKLLEQMCHYILKQKYSYRIDIELGRYIAASCGSYYTEIVDIKKADERNYCLIDGGTHHINYYGSNMAMRTPIVRHESGIKNYKNELEQNAVKAMNDRIDEYMVCGSLCSFADILVRGLKLNNPQIGDTLIFENMGAYSVTEGIYLFLSRNLPGIYLKKQNGKVVELRKQMPSYEINSIQ